MVQTPYVLAGGDVVGNSTNFTGATLDIGPLTASGVAQAYSLPGTTLIMQPLGNALVLYQ